MTVPPSAWRPWPRPEAPHHTVRGTVLHLPGLGPPDLPERDVYVHLPPGHGTDGLRYPVLYMQDGQNLFDDPTSFAGEWRADEALLAAAEEGRGAIVVGVANAAAHRPEEYSPFRDPRYGGGEGETYLRFLAETLKPIVDRDFRTAPDREHTGIAGSSLGGLISLYGLFARPDVFGFAGALSPALWFAEGAIFGFVERAEAPGARIYLDVGSREGRSAVGHTRRMRRLLRRKGFLNGRDLLYVREWGGRHREAAWARRFPRALRFLSPPPVPAEAEAPSGASP